MNFVADEEDNISILNIDMLRYLIFFPHDDILHYL